MVKKAAQATPNRLLQAARKEQGWTQKEVADRIGAPHAFNVNRWEHGTAFPSAYYIKLLCQLFGKSPRELGLVYDELPDKSEASASADERGQSTAIPFLWMLPYRRNRFFTGREQVLLHLHDTLTTARSAALTQIQAISGLGGIGKTQIAVEYAYRYRHEYRSILWVRAATRDALLSDFVTLASLLRLPEQDEQDQHHVVAAVKNWLADNRQWLLILNNADDLNLVVDFLPTGDNGQILLTTRAQATGSIAPTIAVEKMDLEEGILLLLRRAKLLAPDARLDQGGRQEWAQAKAIVEAMDGLPLALAQAGAYIEETGCSLAGYLELYSIHRKELLQRRSALPSDHPETVATTWMLSFFNVEQANPAAADLLRLCAFLDPDAIPEEIITASTEGLGSILEPIASDALKRNEAIEILRKYSLLRRSPGTEVLNMHRLVQAVLKDSMDDLTQRQWAERAVRIVNAAFPEVTFSNWKRCQQYLPHAQSCASLIEQYHFTFPEAARLLTAAGWYLQERALYTQAEPLLERVLAIREQVLGPEHPDTAVSLTNLALLYFHLSKLKQAEPLLERVLAIREQVLGPEHPDMAVSLTNLAKLYQAQVQFKQAEQFYQRALTVYMQVLGPEHRDTMSSAINLLGIYYLQGNYRQAEALFQQALAMSEHMYGPEHPTTASSLNNLAALYYVQDKLEMAEALLQRALAIREKALGPEHTATANILNNLATLYCAQGKLEQARLLMRHALAIREKALGPEHSSIANTLNSLAVLYHMQGNYAEAEPLYRRAMNIQEQIQSPIPTYINNLALLYYVQDNFEQAEPLLQQELTMWEQSLGPENHFTALGLNNLAALYHYQGKYEQAEPLYLRLLTICEKGLVPEILDVATYLENYADLLRKKKHAERAIGRDELA